MRRDQESVGHSENKSRKRDEKKKEKEILGRGDAEYIGAGPPHFHMLSKTCSLLTCRMLGLFAMFVACLKCLLLVCNVCSVGLVSYLRRLTLENIAR